MFENFKKIIEVLHGSIAQYDKERDQFVLQFCSESASHLLGCEVDELPRENDNALELVCEADRAQVDDALRSAMEKGRGLSAYFRVKNKNHHLKWCQLNSWDDEGRYLVLFSGMSPEMQLFQSIAEEAADDIYVIGKNDYSLLYANELNALSARKRTDPARPAIRFCMENLLPASSVRWSKKTISGL